MSRGTCVLCGGSGSCRACQGKGKLECEYCYGTGKKPDGTDCAVCGGRGHKECQMCHGTGKCAGCGGSGSDGTGW